MHAPIHRPRASPCFHLLLPPQVSPSLSKSAGEILCSPSVCRGGHALAGALRLQAALLLTVGSTFHLMGTSPQGSWRSVNKHLPRASVSPPGKEMNVNELCDAAGLPHTPCPSLTCSRQHSGRQCEGSKFWKRWLQGVLVPRSTVPAGTASTQSSPLSRGACPVRRGPIEPVSPPPYIPTPAPLSSLPGPPTMSLSFCSLFVLPPNSPLQSPSSSPPERSPKQTLSTGQVSPPPEKPFLPSFCVPHSRSSWPLKCPGLFMAEKCVSF